jgi:hypothetical protein
MVNVRQTAQALSRAMAMVAMVATPGLAIGEPAIGPLQQQLQLAICLSNWDTAIDLVGALIASPQLSAVQRNELVRFRHQFQDALRQDIAIGLPSSCEERLARYGPTVLPTAAHLDWDGAFRATTGASQETVTPDQVARQQIAARRAGLTRTLETDIAPLSPARVIPTQSGSGVSAGAVSTAADIYAFVGGAGDRVSLEVEVNQVLTGRLYTDDDSQIFLFDSEGRLLVDNDDLSRLQSHIQDFPLPSSGLYYVAVTTYNNDPMLDSSQRITRWNGNGGSAIEYTITVTGLTPTAQLALPQEELPH